MHARQPSVMHGSQPLLASIPDPTLKELFFWMCFNRRPDPQGFRGPVNARVVPLMEAMPQAPVPLMISRTADAETDSRCTTSDPTAGTCGDGDALVPETTTAAGLSAMGHDAAIMSALPQALGALAMGDQASCVRTEAQPCVIASEEAAADNLIETAGDGSAPTSHPALDPFAAQAADYDLEPSVLDAPCGARLRSPNSAAEPATLEVPGSPTATATAAAAAALQAALTLNGASDASDTSPGSLVLVEAGSEQSASQRNEAGVSSSMLQGRLAGPAPAAAALVTDGDEADGAAASEAAAAEAAGARAAAAGAAAAGTAAADAEAAAEGAAAAAAAAVAAMGEAAAPGGTEAAEAAAARMSEAGAGAAAAEAAAAEAAEALEAGANTAGAEATGDDAAGAAGVGAEGAEAEGTGANAAGADAAGAKGAGTEANAAGANAAAVNSAGAEGAGAEGAGANAAGANASGAGAAGAEGAGADAAGANTAGANAAGADAAGAKAAGANAAGSNTTGADAEGANAAGADAAGVNAAGVDAPGADAAGTDAAGANAAAAKAAGAEGAAAPSTTQDHPSASASTAAAAGSASPSELQRLSGSGPAGVVPRLNLTKLRLQAADESPLKSSLRRSKDSPGAAPGSPGPGGMMSSLRRVSVSPAVGGGAGSPRDALGSTARRGSHLAHKPNSAMFPKREESTVPRRDEALYGLNLGKAVVGADLRGAPAPQPCRIKLVWNRNPESMSAVKVQEAARPSSQELKYRDPEGAYTAKPYWSEISSAWYETAYWSERKVLILQLELGDSGMTYEAGDSLSILPVNPPELVANLMKRLRLSGDEVFNIRAVDAGERKGLLPHLPCPCTVGYALAHSVDITGTPTKALLRMLADSCSEATDKRTLTFFTSKAGQDAYQHEIQEHQPSLLDLLNRFSSCSPPLDALLDALPPLAPRLYTISTAAPASPHKVQVAVSIVRFKTRYGTRAGVASSWLERLAQPLTSGVGAQQPPRVPILLQRSTSLRLPTDLSKPLIMIAVGTGLSPFRGFLQQRRALLASMPSGQVVGPASLYFGCRREDEDYLYKSDMDFFLGDGTLSELKVAYTRAKAEKVFVQDLVKQDACEVAAMMAAGGCVFVCDDGGASGMSARVHAALVQAVKDREGLTDEEAASKLDGMVPEKRYIRETWSRSFGDAQEV